MIVIGIETSGFEGSVALSRDEDCLAEIELNQAGRRHAQSLVLEISEVLRTNGLKPRDVDLVAVSRGPGSFTGLRVGMVCAKTFAYATECRFIAVDTFNVIAENLPIEITHAHVVEDAQRNDLFAGEYRRNTNGNWDQISPIRIVSTNDFLNERSASDIVTGPGVKKLLVEKSNSTRATWLSDLALCQPRAAIVAAIGHQQRMSNTEGVPTNNTDFWLSSPFYLRLSAAEEKRENEG